MSAALGVADAEGLAEVPMARVAQALGVPGASIYRHAANRADLLVGLVDHALAAWRIPAPGRDPVSALAAAQRSLREALRDHPGARAAPAAQGLLGDSRLPVLERLSAIFAAAGYRAAEAMVLAAELAPAAAALIGVEQDLLGTREQAARGETLRRLRGRLLVLDPAAYPTLAHAADELEEGAGADLFEEGLALLLDGLRKRMASVTD